MVFLLKSGLDLSVLIILICFVGLLSWWYSKARLENERVRKKTNAFLNLTFFIFFRRSAGGARPETVREGRRRVEHRRHFVHFAVRLPALLRRKRRQFVRADPQGWVAGEAVTRGGPTVACIDTPGDATGCGPGGNSIKVDAIRQNSVAAWHVPVTKLVATVRHK